MPGETANPAAPVLRLSRARYLPMLLCILGSMGASLGLALNPRQFAFAWLIAFLFFLTVALGALFLIMMHHLFDAAWSVPLRRALEHLAAASMPWLILLFLPVALLARQIYPWLRPGAAADPLVQARWPLLTIPGFWLVSALCLVSWWVLASRLRHRSLAQDQDDSEHCTLRLRRLSAAGLMLFAFTLTLASVLWMMSLQPDWSSTMFGVGFFAGAAWVGTAAAYLLAILLRDSGILANVLHDRVFYFLGTLLLAFTIFHAYIHFSQYLVVWSANLPEETSWYLAREKGSWRSVGLVMVWGHFLLPFLALLRIDLKLKTAWMLPLCGWVFLMHYLDLAFHILPALQPDGLVLGWLWIDLSCLALIGGLLARAFMRAFQAHAPYPIRDPRLAEALDEAVSGPSPISGGEPDDLERPSPTAKSGGAS